MQRASNRSRGFLALASAASLASFGIATFSVAPAFADPLPGEIMKFDQRPLDATPVAGALFWGHDELSTATLGATGANVYRGTFMADDFSDKVSQPVVHI